MIGHLRRTSAILLGLAALLLAAGVLAPAWAADNAVPAPASPAGSPAAAAEAAPAPPPAMNTGDTAWLLVSAALVMFMTPGLALFYGGMVRRKNVLGTVVQSFIILGVPQLCPLFPNIDCNTVFQNNVGQQVDPSITQGFNQAVDDL